MRNLTDYLPRDIRRSRRDPATIAGTLVAGAAVLVVGAFAAYFVKERLQEEAEHEVLESDGAFSLRRYAPQVLASTQAQGGIAQALDQGFGRLFAYIGAKPGGRRAGQSADDQGGKIAMTTPVTAAAEDEHPGTWKVSFVMPRGHFRSTLPQPGEGVVIEEVPGRLVAAVRFSGRGTDQSLIAAKRAELMAWIAARGMTVAGEPAFAAYNAPIVPGTLRRNEWLVPVTA